MKFNSYILKRRIEDLLMLPLIGIGRLAALLKPLPRQYRIYFFFSFYHIGGAEKVHAQVANATGGNDCIIFFTRKSSNDLLRQVFVDSGCVIKDISRFTDNRWLYPLNIIFRGILSGYINRQSIPTSVFNGQCNIGYKISPWISSKVLQVELIHSLNTFSYIRIPFLPFINRTVMISTNRIGDHMELSRRKGIPESFNDRVRYISNAIDVPAVLPAKQREELVVLYAGRGGTEKRLHLVTRIAEEVNRQNALIRFEIMGDVSNILDPSSNPSIRFYGNVSDPALISKIYQRASILLLTSETEGFPMVIIEAMAHGGVIMSTPVGDIPRHVTMPANGLLFSTVKEEDQIVREATAFVIELAGDRDRLEKISATNRAYALASFDLPAFKEAYNRILQPENPSL